MGRPIPATLPGVGNAFELCDIARKRAPPRLTKPAV